MSPVQFLEHRSSEVHIGPLHRRPNDLEAVLEVGQDVLPLIGHLRYPLGIHRLTDVLADRFRQAETLNISRQAVIKTMLREALDRRYLAQQASIPLTRKVRG